MANPKEHSHLTNQKRDSSPQKRTEEEGGDRKRIILTSIVNTD